MGPFSRDYGIYSVVIIITDYGWILIDFVDTPLMTGKKIMLSIVSQKSLTNNIMSVHLLTGGLKHTYNNIMYALGII